MLDAVGVRNVAPQCEGLRTGPEQRDRGRQAAFIDVRENYLHAFVGATDREFAAKSAGRACDDSYLFTKLFHPGPDGTVALFRGF
jgi:hypothetical protein